MPTALLDDAHDLRDGFRGSVSSRPVDSDELRRWRLSRLGFLRMGAHGVRSVVIR